MKKPDTLKLQVSVLDFYYQFAIQKSTILGINEINPKQKRERI